MAVVAGNPITRPPPRLKRGDEMVFVPRPRALKNTAVQVLRRGEPLLWPTPNGLFQGYGLGRPYERSACEEHARAKAAEYELRTGAFWEEEGSLHVRLL
ncbi:MAG TPA: hypothetical protein VJ837_03000 [Candidatus Paceibacterota bacterium]|nr:hypothetical protein [Candidatus Paceibacterota bacterium]